MKKVEIQLIRNATLKINYANQMLLVDPMLSPKNSFMSFVVPNENLNPTVDLPLPIETITKDVDMVLLTHSHPDHLDPKAIEVLPKNIPLFGQPADKEMLKTNKFTEVSIVDSVLNYKDITITRTVGKHGPDELLDALGEVSGYILQAENYPTIYIIGDCIWDKDIENSIKKYNPDIIVTNSGGAIFMGKDRILMDDKETVLVARMAPKATVIATHVESLDHCPITRKQISTIASKENLNILTPADGVVIKL